MKTRATTNKDAAKTRRNGETTPLTHIEYTNADAGSVFVAGTFNDWHPMATEMINLGNGRWAKDLTLPPGTYEYRLVVDGQWVADPRALESVANPFGDLNSVLKVSPSKTTE